MSDDFVNVFFEENVSSKKPKVSEEKQWFEEWADHSSAPHDSPEVYGYRALQKLYPGHSIVMTQDMSMSLMSFPHAYSLPLETDSPLITNVFFIPLARRLGDIPGVLVDSVEYGVFRVAWDKYEFTVFAVQFFRGYKMVQHYIVHDGPEAPVRALLVAAGAWHRELHDEIWVYDKYWYKDHNLWREVQKGNWKDVILKDEFKKALQKDVLGFFSSENIYKELAIPWKRGLILYGPPGNGKTISIKVIMKECGAKGFNPLYVKSFQGWFGEEASMADVFSKARELAPCVVVLEDLDSLINDSNRSFFLNQLDGLEGNDGLLVIGTTNHFDKLDPALSGRPSRFDRKYLFDDPDKDERKLYCQYWQGKLANNKDISFPDSLLQEIVDSTDKFSFAYLKEAFVSSLVLMAGEADEKDFGAVIRSQIKELKKTLNREETQPQPSLHLPSAPTHKPAPTQSTAHKDSNRNVRVLLDSLSTSTKGSDTTPSRIFYTPSTEESAKDSRRLLVNLSRSFSARGDNSQRVFAPNAPSTENAAKDPRTLLDDLSRSFSASRIDTSKRTFISSPAKPESANSGVDTANNDPKHVPTVAPPFIPRTEQRTPETNGLTGISRSGVQFTWYNPLPPRE